MNNDFRLKIKTPSWPRIIARGLVGLVLFGSIPVAIIYVIVHFLRKFW